MRSLMEPTVQARQIDQRPLILIDGLFHPDFIKLFDHFLKALRFSLLDYDTEDDLHVLHWIHEFSLGDVTTHPLLKYAYSRIRSVSEKLYSEPRIQLQRIHCNASLYGDIQLPHHDITPGLTWLYYANP